MKLSRSDDICYCWFLLIRLVNILRWDLQWFTNTSPPFSRFSTISSWTINSFDHLLVFSSSGAWVRQHICPELCRTLLQYGADQYFQYFLFVYSPSSSDYRVEHLLHVCIVHVRPSLAVLQQWVQRRVRRDNGSDSNIEIDNTPPPQQQKTPNPYTEEKQRVKGPFYAYILKASLVTPTIPQKKLNFSQSCPKMPQKGPKMAKNDPKWPKYDPKWP